MREGPITNEYGQPASPVSLTPVLLDSQIQRLSDAAEALIKSLPPMDPKLATNKKRISKELEVRCLRTPRPLDPPSFSSSSSSSSSAA